MRMLQNLYVQFPLVLCSNDQTETLIALHLYREAFLARGASIIISRRSVEHKFGATRSQFERLLDNLDELGLAKVEATNRGTRISILSMNKQQPTNSPPTSQPAAHQQPTVKASKRPTENKLKSKQLEEDSPPTAHQQPTLSAHEHTSKQPTLSPPIIEREREIIEVSSKFYELPNFSQSDWESVANVVTGVLRKHLGKARLKRPKLDTREAFMIWRFIEQNSVSFMIEALRFWETSPLCFQMRAVVDAKQKFYTWQRMNELVKAYRRTRVSGPALTGSNFSVGERIANMQVEAISLGASHRERQGYPRSIKLTDAEVVEAGGDPQVYSMLFDSFKTRFRDEFGLANTIREYGKKYAQATGGR